MKANVKNSKLNAELSDKIKDVICQNSNKTYYNTKIVLFAEKVNVDALVIEILKLIKT